MYLYLLNSTYLYYNAKVLHYGEKQSSTYVTNRNHCCSLLKYNKTPAESWTNKRENLSKLKVFRCRAFVHIPEEDTKCRYLN